MLVVEDDHALGDLVHAILTDEGYAVSLLSESRLDGVRAAVGLLEPDCILLDSGGKGDYSQSWRDAVWAHGRARPVPVVMFTTDARASAEARAGETQRSREAAFFAVLSKPFDIDALLAVVERATAGVTRFDRSAAAEGRRTAALVAKLEASGARDVHPSTRREWATFYAGDVLSILYWSERDGVYYVLRHAPQGGSFRQVGRFYDLDLAVALATSEGAPAGTGEVRESPRDEAGRAKDSSSRVGEDRPLVLLVERHADTRLVLRFALEWRGYAVAEARDDVEGATLAQQEAPALVLLDVARDDPACRRFLEPFSSVPAPRAPVVALTAAGLPVQEALRERSAEIAAVIAKPFEIEELLVTVERLAVGVPPSR